MITTWFKSKTKCYHNHRNGRRACYKVSIRSTSKPSSRSFIFILQDWSTTHISIHWSITKHSISKYAIRVLLLFNVGTKHPIIEKKYVFHVYHKNKQKLFMGCSHKEYVCHKFFFMSLRITLRNNYFFRLYKKMVIII